MPNILTGQVKWRRHSNGRNLVLLGGRERVDPTIRSRNFCVAVEGIQWHGRRSESGTVLLQLSQSILQEVDLNP